MRVMEKWQWEVCKMFMYMAFPVAMFHYFNSPQLFEEDVYKIKEETYTTVSSERRKKVEELVRKVNADLQLKSLEKLEKSQPSKANN